MAQRIMEWEGTWDELAKHAKSFRGHRLRLTVLPDEEPISETPAERPALSQRFAAIREGASGWDDLPRDLAEQHDHYIYGSEKR